MTVKLRMGNKYQCTTPDGVTHNLEYYRRDTLKDGSRRHHFQVIFQGELCDLTLEESELSDLVPVRKVL